MYLLQRQMMYFPWAAPEHTRYEVIDIESGGLMIKVVTQGSQGEPAVIYFGGNGEYAVSHLVLISPYDSIANVAAKHYPFFPRSLIKDKFDSVSWASKISAKTLIVMARDDDIIPISHSQRLLEALKHTQPISMVYDQADHNNVHLKAGFMPMIRGFLAL